MNILITSVGRRSYMIKYFQEALAGCGTVHAANSEYTYAMQIADKYVITPLIYETNYINFLINYCNKNNIKMVISLFDIDLPILAKNKKHFKNNGITLVISDFKVTQICNDKWKAYKFLCDNNISTPRSYLTLQKTYLALKNNYVSFPLIVKPRWGMGSMGIFEVENKRELEIFFEKAHKIIFNSYLSYESEKNKRYCVLIQEKLSGEEYGLDVINNMDGKYITTFVKKKIAMRSGETDIAITEKNSILEEIGSKLSNKLGHIGNLDVDCFLTKNKPFILEMNCRFGGNYPFSHLAGANIPLAIIKWINGQTVPENLLKMKDNVIGAKDINPVQIIR